MAASNMASREEVLAKYGISLHALVARGMEAEVYLHGPDTLLKLYAGSAHLDELIILQRFYDSIGRREDIPFALPRIHEVARDGPFIVTIEQRLPGMPMSAGLPSLTNSQLEKVMERYLTASLAVSRIEAPALEGRYRLFDSGNMSDRSRGDWHHFLARLLARQMKGVGMYLRRDVPGLDDRLSHLQALLRQPYRGDYRLIHGDLFPGNWLIDERHEITALLDFGLWTMRGDRLFDIATGWAFFDMYDELGVNARERLLDRVLDRLGEHVRAALYRYLLIYSILSANTYSSTCSDGHYRWCVANLSNPHYWAEGTGVP